MCLGTGELVALCSAAQNGSVRLAFIGAKLSTRRYGSAAMFQTLLPSFVEKDHVTVFIP
jgi:hypothetical protein